ncbi:hypothetical protein C8Q77DRAFT_1061993 [Trametes polyzona]|nr:hypothetical protein C8Q77DRAFT_1061993 [Trametes polyzona]
MFTPPPSPEPRRVQHPSSASAAENPPKSLHALDVSDDPFLRPHFSRINSSGSGSLSPERPPREVDAIPLSPKEDPYAHIAHEKKRAGRRTKWTVVLVPLVLALIGLSTRYLTHPAVFDVLRPRTGWKAPVDDAAQGWQAHKRHPEPADVPSATTLSISQPAGSSLSLAPSASAVPTATDKGNTQVPAAPPALPTPFPQPFDDSLSTNFTTVACQTFFTNMTLASAFRTCRPFSLLVSDSNAFITQSQRNISLLNTIIWGTCNTVPSAEQCEENMAWFADNIKTQCKGDIDANNPIVQDAVAGLEGYGVMRSAACQINSATNTYCYVDAAQSGHASDLYLYQLAIGLRLPNGTVPSCTPCVQTVMRTLVQGGADLPALQKTYPAAAQVVNGACGAEFVANLASTGQNGARRAGERMVAAVAGAAIALLLGALMAL